MIRRFFEYLGVLRCKTHDEIMSVFTTAKAELRTLEQSMAEEAGKAAEAAAEAKARLEAHLAKANEARDSHNKLTAIFG